MKLLVTDDDKNLRTVLTKELTDEGFDVSAAENVKEALSILDSRDIDVLLLDLNMPDGNGMEVLKKIRSADIPVEVIFLTAYATVSTAVEAMKQGAYDYLTKPFKIEDLITVINKAYERKQLVSENISLKSQIRHQHQQKQFITGSPVMLHILEDLKKVAQSDFPVLITGESGVGKELIASAIHHESGRPEGPFIPINCGAIPENMMETELFGHEKGAFTGAVARKPGLLELANSGSIFFDEIGEMPWPLQVKLLRVIETRNFMRLGGTREITIDPKMIFATNKDLTREVEEKNFRKDLYYRIETFHIEIPPLRDRKEDIPLLINHFMNTNHICRGKSFSSDAIRALSEYSWPGNVRELQNVIYKVLLLARHNVIDSEALPADIVSVKRHFTSKRIADVEEEHILNVLEEAGGNQKKAAEMLGIDPKTLYRKLKGYGVKEQ